MEEGRKRNSDMSLNEVYFWTSTIVEWKHLLKLHKYKEIIVGCLRTLKEMIIPDQTEPPNPD